ncbi:MAG TPA: alkaline phosphatase family protein [Anaerolineales bacterium]|nr:alkaline phosphatase family protein [Anaerolineales bacterium]
MKKVLTFNIMIAFVVILSACETSTPTIVPTNTPIPVDASKPCIGAPAPAQWHHIVVLMFENKTYDQVIGPAPYITSLANKCATASNWQDANTKVDGSPDGKYASKPNYATLTNGLSPSAHGLLDDTYATTTNVDNIYSQLNLAGLTFKDYYEAEAGGCGVRFSGDYHDPIRYYDNVASICDAHDVPLSTFMTDLNNGNLPAFSVLLPTNQHNMHSNSVSSGDAYAQTILDPLLNSQAYAKGDLAIFFLWDENSPIPNVLLAPSVVTGTKITVPAGNPVSHFSALRTWEEMLGLPLLGDTKFAPSLSPFFGSHAPLP